MWFGKLSFYRSCFVSDTVFATCHFHLAVTFTRMLGDGSYPHDEDILLDSYSHYGPGDKISYRNNLQSLKDAG